MAPNQTKKGKAGSRTLPPEEERGAEKVAVTEKDEGVGVKVSVMAAHTVGSLKGANKGGEKEGKRKGWGQGES